MTFKTFLKECNEKEVFKKLSIYIVACWIILQVLSVTQDYIGIPARIITVILILMLIGLPINIFYIWKFSLAPLEVNHIELDKKGNKKRSKFQKMYFSSLVMLSILVGLVSIFIINNKFIESIRLPEIESSDKIAILKFGNNTGIQDLDIVSKMTTDWIMHGITENQVAQVISPEIVSDYSDILKVSKASSFDGNAILEEFFKPKKIISGNFFLQNNKLIFQSSISEDEKSYAFKPVECNKDNPLECIESLKQLILGYLITEDKVRLQDIPPKFEAYLAVLEAKVNYQNDSDKYLELMEKAIELDSSYFEPKMLQISVNYNMGNFIKADSLRREAIKTSAKINKRQRNMLNFYKSLMSGKSDGIYSTMQKEYNYSPFDIQTNKTMMAAALQFVNKPEDIDSIYSKISMQEVDLDLCYDCEDRILVKAFADLELERYDSVIDLLKPFSNGIDRTYFKVPLIKAYLRNGNKVMGDAILKKLKLKAEEKNWQKVYNKIGADLLILNRKSEATEYFDKVIKNSDSIPNDQVAYAYFLKENYNNAEIIYEKIHESDPEDHDIISKLAVCYYKNDKIALSKNLIASLENLRKDYQFGNIDYVIARFYALIGDKDNTFKYLLQSVSSGKRYDPLSFQNDPHFIPYLGTEMFNQILTFWHK